jgi:hypothetical protein
MNVAKALVFNTGIDLLPAARNHTRIIRRST